jgi:hypothetical protein
MNEEEKIKLISEGKKKCKTCDKIMTNEYFYGRNWVCKECFKEEMKLKRLENKQKEVPNKEYSCSQCKNKKHASEFRAGRGECKECEKENERNYRKSIVGKEKAKIWSNNNKEQHAKLQANWYQQNKDRIIKKEAERSKNDSIFRL